MGVHILILCIGHVRYAHILSCSGNIFGCFVSVTLVCFLIPFDVSSLCCLFAYVVPLSRS